MDTKHKMLFCHGCHEVFARPSARGRPPRFCNKCGGDHDVVHRVDREKQEEKEEVIIEKANARVDRLEFMLRSRNTHIKQHRKD